MDIVEGPFQTSMLEWTFDFMKMDGEGCEKLLFEVDRLPPCAIEVHEQMVVDRLTERFDLTVLPQKDNWIVQNFVQTTTKSAVS